MKFIENVEMAKQNMMRRLLDMNDTTVSTTNLFVIIVTIIGLVLLSIPAAAIIVELCYTHTVSMSWADIASYIGAVALMFGSVGITKAWTSWSNAKYNALNKDTLNDNLNNDEV